MVVLAFRDVFRDGDEVLFPTESARFPQALWLAFRGVDWYSQEVASASREQSVAACKLE
jgi:hypothetical protein